MREADEREQAPSLRARLRYLPALDERGLHFPVESAALSMTCSLALTRLHRQRSPVVACVPAPTSPRLSADPFLLHRSADAAAASNRQAGMKLLGAGSGMRLAAAEGARPEYTRSHEATVGRTVGQVGS
jgi:hypothetical protein